MMVASWADAATEAIANLVASRTGLVFAPNHIENAEAAIGRAMRRAGIAEVAQYLRLLKSETLPIDDLIAEVTVGETYFFRDPALFDIIRRQILPDIARRTGASRPIRLWSAGCASGEEAYSLAILAQEEHLAERVHILATDISRSALARARAASYSQWSLRACDPAFIARYFRRAGARFDLDPRFRARITFEYLNLALDSYPSMLNGTWGMDLILCRNVMIYLDRRTVEGVARRLIECLAEGGLLVTGPSDPWLAEIAPCETVPSTAGTFYRRAGTGKEDRFRAATSKLSPDPLDLPVPPVPSPAAAEVSIPPAPLSSGGQGPLESIHDAFAKGQWDRILDLTGEWRDDPGLAALRIRALANVRGPAPAVHAAAEAVGLHPLSAELHFLRAVLLVGVGHDDDAAQSARCAIYLDRSLAAAHYTLGSILRRRGDRAGARRAYRNALAICAGMLPDEVVPLSDGERAGRLAEAAKVQLDLLEAGS